MSLELKVIALVFLLFIILLIFSLIKKEKVSIKYSVIWLTSLIVIFFFIIIPGFLSFATKLLGFQTSSNMIISLLLAVLIIISIMLTVIVSKQKEQIRLLIQELSLIKEKINEKKKY